MSRNYLDSYQFRLDDQAFCERMDRLAAAREANADTGRRDGSDVTDPGTPNEPIEGTGL
jgi:hypothetical protein